MNPCKRDAAPSLLAKYGVEIGEAYFKARTVDPAFRFRWPQRDGLRLYDVVFDALHAMTDGHCSYCDGYPIDATGEEQVDHFQPKGHPAFYKKVADWENLFLSCTACNKTKLEQWDDALLRPDSTDYQFGKYFLYDSDTGKIEPNPRASAPEQTKANKTIEVFNLNRPGACTTRKWAADRLISGGPNASRITAYRFLIPLCISTKSPETAN